MIQTLAQSTPELLPWLLGIVGTVSAGVISTLLGMVIKNMRDLTTAINNNTQAIAVIQVELKRVDAHEEELEQIKPKLHEVYLHSLRHGMRATGG